jgi:acetyltransferase-like isoleucine patch superfamily enzyme
MTARPIQRLRALRDLAELAPTGERPTSMFALAWQSLRQDQPGKQFFRNKIAGSSLMPRALRWLLYRVSGLRIDTPKVREGCLMENSYLEVGYGSSISRGCYFEGSGRISIGTRTSIGPECAFLTSHHDRDADGNVRSPGSRPIAIGSRVWLGARVTVLPGAVVEDGCTIAAGAVVTGRCRGDTVYGGVPAMPLKKSRADAVSD